MVVVKETVARTTNVIFILPVSSDPSISSVFSNCSLAPSQPPSQPASHELNVRAGKKP